MPKGIVRATERVAIWHEAAEEESEQPDITSPYHPDWKPPTSEPPAGDTPEPVAVSKSKKFITPANQLKKTLEPLPAPTESAGPVEGHPDLQAFTQKHPAFAKSYFKPDYQDMLKAHLGEQNYDKLLNHLPYEHFQALSIHEQAPAPNSKKFTGPATSLKKLLDDPHTETSHVQQWLASPQGSAFAKTYLKPGYQDALKGHLGEKGYAELQTHLNAPEKAQEKAPEATTHPTSQAISDELKAHHQMSDDPEAYGQKIKDMSPEQAQEALQQLQEFHGDASPHASKYQEILDKHFGQPQAETLGQKMQAINPSINAQVFDKQPPEGQKDILQNIWAKDPQHGPAMQQLYNEHFGHPGDSDPVFQEWYGDQINADEGAWDQEHPQDKDNLYQQYHHEDPELKQHYQDVVDQGAGSDAEQAAAIQQHMEEPETKEDLDKWFEDNFGGKTADPAALTQGLKKVFPNLDPSFEQLPPEQQKAQLQNMLKYLPEHEGYASHVPQLQALYDQHFGGSEQQPQTLNEAWKEAFPNSGDLIGKTPEEQLQAFMAGYHSFKDDPGYGPKLQKIYNQFVGSGNQQQPEGTPDEDHIQAIQDLLQPVHSPQQGLGDKLKAIGLKPSVQALEKWNQAEPGHMQQTVLPNLLENFPNKKEKIQQVFDEHFGGGGQPEHTFNPSESYEDPATGDWQHNEASLPPGLKAYAEEEGVPLGNYAGWELQNLLDKGWSQLTPEDKQQYAAQEQPEGQQAQQYSHPPAAWANQFHPEEEPWTNEEIGQLTNQSGMLGHWNNLSPHAQQAWWDEENQQQSGPDLKALGAELQQLMPNNHQSQKFLTDPSYAKGIMQGWLGSNPDAQPEIKALYDKYFGEGSAQPSAQSGPQPTPQGIENYLIKNHGWGSAPPGLAKLKKASDPEQMKAALEELKNSSPGLKDEVQDTIDHFFGSGAGGAQSQFSQQQFDTSKNPGAEYLESLGVKPSSANSMGSQSSQLFWNNFNAVKGDLEKNGESSKMPEQWQTVVKGMMAQGGPQQPTKPEFDWDTFGPEFKALYPNSSWANDPQSEQAAQQKLQNAVANANENFPDSDKTKAVTQLYQKWFGEGGEQSHDPDQMSTDWENVIGKTHQWDFSDPEKVAKFKKQLAAQLEGTGYWDPWSPEKMKAGQAFYDKYFGSGGGNADLNAIQQHMEEEEPTEPAKPFKSEELNADDFNQWAANKPQDAAQWKDFATWWGNTKMPPEAEAELYNTWFGKQASPEQAQQWFQAVFEHNSQPSEGDLGSNYTPSWAHNSWAFGDKAEQEWPLFQTWATQHPGIPKNTSIKQKLAIWNGLSDQDKSQIADEYLPQNQVDTKAVVKALKAAYPDSDWSKWAKLPQSALKQSVESLAHSGYGGAIPVFNQFFGGEVPMPEETPQEEPTEQAQPTEFELPPVSALPAWIQPQMEGKGPGAVAKLTKEFMGLHNLATSVGQQDAVMGDTKPYELGKMWNALPGYLKAQIAGMTTPPWHDMEGFEAWKNAQPTVTDAVKEVLGLNLPGLSDKSKAYYLGKYIDTQEDPQTKAQLLGIYHQFFGHDQTTLAEGLKGIDPDTDWDKALQGKSKNQVASLVKKQLKTEQDPVKWTQLANLWSKHFPHPTNSNDIAPTGIKALTDFFKYKSPNKALGAQDLHMLKAYKQNYPNNESGYIGWHGEPDDVAKELAAQDEGKSFMPYHGWTPPSGTSMAKFVADPASYAKSPAEGSTYAVPEAAAKGKEYQGLLDRADQMESGFFSAKDKAALKSDTFANWFNKAPLAYRQQRQDNPGVALDDFDDFMSGGAPYPKVGVPAGKEKFIDVSPFAAVPAKGKGTLPKSQTHNPQRGDFVKFPRQQDPQETLPLGPGERFAPGYAPLPIYRLVNLNLDKQIDPNHAPAQYKTPQQKGLWAQQQQSRLRRIDEILNGSNAQRDPKKDFEKLQQWGQNYGLSDKEVSEVAGILLGKQPDLFTDEKWHSIEDFGKAQKAKGKEIDLSDLHDLARDLEVTPPPNAKGNYDHPELGQLILDYMENTAHRSDAGDDDDDDVEARGSQGGLGWHWTRAINKIYKGIPAAGQDVKATPRNVPVAISGLWGGQGEGAGHGQAFSPTDKNELEHNLYSHAPVHIRRLQIRAPGHSGQGGWHDTIDHGPISLWGPGRYEEGNEKTETPGKQVGYKPSLAEELDKVVPGTHSPKDFDTMVPGHRADNTFAQLIHDNPGQKEQLLKIYQDFFVGRPDLPTKPHTRRASVTPPVRIARLDERNPAHLFDLARNWGIAKPERYGIPLTQAKEFLTDLKGVGWATKEVVKEHGLGIPNPRRGQPTVAALEDQIVRLAASPAWGKTYEDEYPEHPDNDYDDELESWQFSHNNEDYEDDDDGEWENPPGPDEPEHITRGRPELPGDSQGRRYFSPHQLNPESTSEYRPQIDWGHVPYEQDVLPFKAEDDPDWDEAHGDFHGMWPHDTGTLPLYRGYTLDLTHPELGEVRRALHGPAYEGAYGEKNHPLNMHDKALAQAHPLGYDNPALGEKILDFLDRHGRDVGGQNKFGLGGHWTTNSDTATQFAHQTSHGAGHGPLILPVKVRAQWKGLGEDPYRTHTLGDWDENEVTMLPTSKMHVDSVQIHSPEVHDGGQWHETLPEPMQRSAGSDPLIYRDPVAWARADVDTNGLGHTPGDEHFGRKVDVRKPRGILTYQDMRA